MPRRYTTLEKLGEGTYGDIYKCVDESTGDIFVLKKLKATTQYAQQLREISIMQRLSNAHPNLVRLVDVTPHDHPELVMEKLPVNLLQFLQSFHVGSGTVPLPYIKTISRDMLRACAFLHSRLVAHRDIKPENVLVELRRVGESEPLAPPNAAPVEVQKMIYDLHADYFAAATAVRRLSRAVASGDQNPETLKRLETAKAALATELERLPLHVTAKLCDFGMSRLMLPDHAYEAKRVPTPRVMTISYRAVEVLLGRTDYAPAVDLWAVGCVIAELATTNILIPWAQLPNDPRVDYGDGIWPNIVSMFQVIGSPTPDEWHSITDVSYSGPMNPDFPRFRPALRKVNNGALPRLLGEEGFELIERMLVLVPERRITAREALRHSFFDGMDAVATTATSSATVAATPVAAAISTPHAAGIVPPAGAS